MTFAEVAHAAPVVLINETAAKLWPAGTSPLGRRVRLDLLDRPGGGLLMPANTTSTVTVVGIIVGLAGSIALTRVMSSLLYNTSALDAVTFSYVSVLLAAVAVMATIIPTRRALRVDPMILN